MSRVTLDLYKCTNYTGQLHQMNRRIQELDKALYDLYDEIGWGNHKYLRRADGIVSYSGKLQRCGNYLSDTASSFQKLQEELYLSDISELAQYKGKSSWKISDTVNAGIGTVGNILNSFSKLFDESTIGTSPSNVWSQVGKGYVNIFKELIGDKVTKYTDRFDSFKTVPDMIVGWYDWFTNDVYGTFDDGKSLLEDIITEKTGQETKLLPEGVSDFFDILSKGEILIDAAKACKEYVETGDAQESFDDLTFSIFGAGFSEWDKMVNKANGLEYTGGADVISKILLKTVVKMPYTWYTGVKEYIETGNGTAGSIFVDTASTIVDVTASELSTQYIAATAVSYPVVDQICEGFGYDLSGEYERLTGETGLKAVFKAQKELWVDVVYEGAKDKAADFVDGLYDTVKDGWASWKSGMKLIFG